MFNILNWIMGNKNKVKQTDLSQKGLVNKVKEDSAGAAKPSLRAHLEEIHGNVCEFGFTDREGNFTVTEIKQNGEWKKFEANPVVKEWEKIFQYVKFEGDDHVEINEKEEK